MIADKLQFGPKRNNIIAKQRPGFFAQTTSVFRIIFVKRRLAVCEKLDRIRYAAHVFLDQNLDKPRLDKLSGRDHFRNMLVLHPVQPLVVNAFGYV